MKVRYGHEKNFGVMIEKAQTRITVMTQQPSYHASLTAVVDQERSFSDAPSTFSRPEFLANSALSVLLNLHLFITLRSYSVLFKDSFPALFRVLFVPLPRQRFIMFCSSIRSHFVHVLLVPSCTPFSKLWSTLNIGGALFSEYHYPICVVISIGSLQLFLSIISVPLLALGKCWHSKSIAMKKNTVQCFS